MSSSSSHKASYCTDYSERYLLFVAKVAKGRPRSSPRIIYRILSKYRCHMMFWARWFYNRRDLPLKSSLLCNKHTTATQVGAAKWGLTMHGVLDRTHLGLPELRQMMYLDMASTLCIALAESHHLAWCIGRMSAVRPRSIGATDKNNNKKKGLYLTWRDVEITRGEQKGMFDTILTFRILKINYDENPGKAAKRAQVSLKVVIKAPRRKENLFFQYRCDSSLPR